MSGNETHLTDLNRRLIDKGMELELHTSGGIQTSWPGGVFYGPFCNATHIARDQLRAEIASLKQEIASLTEV